MKSFCLLTLLFLYLMLIVSNGFGQRSIEFTYVPPYKSSENLRGRVYNTNPDSFKVAVYIFVEGSGWWNKPYQNQPLTPIYGDTWTCDITTGGSDIYATWIRAFIWPNGVPVETASGDPFLPSWLDTFPNTRAERIGPIIHFAGYDWWIKGSIGLIGPGSNYFSDSAQNVWVDSLGRLHLRIIRRNNIWWCSEVVCTDSFGYGPYYFYMDSPVGQLNENVVLGLFTWDNHVINNREIDIEFSRWGDSLNPYNAQYVVQPWNEPGHIHRWWMPPGINSSTHSFNWQPDSVHFLSVRGHYPGDSVLQSWLFNGTSIPTPGDEHPRINLWLSNGSPPSNNNEVEVIIYWFAFGTPGVSETLPTYMKSTIGHLEKITPNPFNHLTTIRFSLWKTTDVKLKIYDIAGKFIKSMIFTGQPPGRHTLEWNGVDNNGKKVHSGVYFLKINVGNYTTEKKIILIR